MAQPTYKATALVLKKTKLGESDLIITFLSEDGCQLRAVAKGARKPTSQFSARLELCSVVDLLCAKGRNLDIVKEARLIASNEVVRTDPAKLAAASCVLDILCASCELNLENPKLFPLSVTALAAIGESDGTDCVAMAAAHMLKTLSLCGFRPNLRVCTACGRELTDSFQSTAPMRISFRDGGVFCDACQAQASCTPVSGVTVGWGEAVLFATFAQIMDMDVPEGIAFELVQLARSLASEHLGSRLKSVDYLLSTGLF